ncbi:hypothetical protein [Vallitalea okinawensis]|uniref:hypothetical protein n=1 Tax=Vallitalea okinawensis TaxID=2078660 RepID=UPI000CFCF85A|nr:hypothetical protein [Vallitalea okinawensis]
MRKLIKFRSIISFTLIFVLLFNLVALDSQARKDQSNPEFGNGMMNIDKNKRNEPKNKFPKAKDEPVELKTKRKSNVKEYVNPDGTFTLEVSQKPVHYKDNRGHWQEIDNTLIESQKNGYKYENKENAFKVRFADNNELNHLVDFSLDEDHWISFSPVGKFNTKGVVTDSTIEYKNFQPGMDLRYILDSDKLKEEIILSKIPKTNIFEFDLEYEGFTFEKDEEGIIWAKSATTGEIEFFFQKSFAEDANGDITFDAV